MRPPHDANIERQAAFGVPELLEIHIFVPAGTSVSPWRRVIHSPHVAM
jgi:hypothetical protein